ncbi:metalloregulator ArsR/SmtB family transcription factor [Rhizobium calliandrae]|uniref:Metalloregulator ArsR/SmtB family transcription factor n=1 Tax=Rhizobium calliandrae TaxID=1312182 RepID=A0ABT7KAM3_9HYPH|nr:metalloregulator ArsR/SmtB family transcription factor [Rhizobium calliandrae]MDL2405607.1 metalloregulator ArsR/SmtB family transcription factor [Rhizobium calliandrae]
MLEEPLALDRMFQALSDQSRRGMIDRLGRGPASVTELAQPFAMALPTVMKHLHVLETSGLVLSEKTGRVRTYHLRKEALATLERWIGERKAGWNRTFDRLDQFLADNSEETVVK